MDVISQSRTIHFVKTIFKKTQTSYSFHNDLILKKTLKKLRKKPEQKAQKKIVETTVL